MTSFMSLFQRDLRLQLPLLIIYCAVALGVTVVFTSLSFRFGTALIGGIIFILAFQNFITGLALPINSLWKEWRLKTVAHWLMLPASIHKKLWSKLLSILLIYYFMILFSTIMWVASGLINYTELHQVIYSFVSQMPIEFYLYIFLFLTYAMVAGSIPFFFGIFMLKGEGGKIGILVTILLGLVYLIFMPWFTAIEVPGFLEIGPVYFASFEAMSYTDENFSLDFGSEANDPLFYISGIIFEVIFYTLMYVLSWWYLARKVEI